MVEEPRDIKKEDRSHTARLNGLLGLVTEGGGRIWGRVMCAGAKLAGTQEVKVIDVGAEPIRHHLLEELPTAFEEGDGAICLGCRIVRFVRLRDDDDRRRVPRVDPEAKRLLEDGGKVLWAGRKAPLEKKVADPRWSWRRSVRSPRKGRGDFRCGDGIEGAGGEAWQLREGKGGAGGEVKESTPEDGSHRRGF